MGEPPAGWEATVDALLPLLPGGKPRLKAELLARPPFRFLHDVVSGVSQTTGFPAPGLFTAAESDARAMDKEAKVSYLTKLVEAIASALGQPVLARPSTIVAGLEPEATCAMLRQLAAAATGGGRLGSTSASSAASGYAQPAGLAAHLSTANKADQGVEQPSVVFQRVDNLLPALARRCDEARSTLGANATPGTRHALALCEKVVGIANDAAVLARSLEQLLGAVPTIAGEAAAWRAEAHKLAARLTEEEQREARASVASARRLADLDKQLAAVKQQVASLRGGAEHA